MRDDPIYSPLRTGFASSGDSRTTRLGTGLLTDNEGASDVRFCACNFWITSLTKEHFHAPEVRFSRVSATPIKLLTHSAESHMNEAFNHSFKF